MRRRIKTRLGPELIDLIDSLTGRGDSLPFRLPVSAPLVYLRLVRVYERRTRPSLHAIKRINLWQLRSLHKPRILDEIALGIIVGCLMRICARPGHHRLCRWHFRDFLLTPADLTACSAVQAPAKEASGINLLWTRSIKWFLRRDMDRRHKLPQSLLLIFLYLSTPRFLAKMFCENIIVVIPLDDLQHCSSEVMQIPRFYFFLLNVILLKHHWIVDLARIIHLLESLWWRDIKRLHDHLSPSSLLLHRLTLFWFYVAYYLIVLRISEVVSYKLVSVVVCLLRRWMVKLIARPVCSYFHSLIKRWWTNFRLIDRWQLRCFVCSCGLHLCSEVDWSLLILEACIRRRSRRSRRRSSLFCFLRHVRHWLPFCFLKRNRGNNIFWFDVIYALNHFQTLLLLLLFWDELLAELCLGISAQIDTFHELIARNYIQLTFSRMAGSCSQTLPGYYHVIITKNLTDWERNQFEGSVEICFGNWLLAALFRVWVCLSCAFGTFVTSWRVENRLIKLFDLFLKWALIRAN